MKSFVWSGLMVLFGTACGPDLVYEDADLRVFVQEKEGVYERMRLDEGASDDFTLGIAQMEGDSVSIGISYSGGCGGADFLLFIDEALAEPTDSVASRPAVLVLEDNDNCEAIVSTQIVVPLSSLPPGPYTLLVYNPSQSGEVASVTIPRP